MRRAILAFIAVVIVIAIAFGIASIPGAVSADFGALHVAMPAPVAVAIFILVVLFLHVVLGLVFGLFGLGGWFRAWRARRRRKAGDRSVTHALLALAAGEGPDASRAAASARRMLGDSPQTLLLAAEAARLTGDNEEAEAVFHTLARRKEGAFLGFRGLLRQAIARSDWVAAAELARKAEAAHPGTKWLRGERRRVAIEAGDWRAALALADPPARAALGAAAADAEVAPKAALRLAEDALAADPTLSIASLALARRLRAAGKEKRAEATIRAAWERAPQPDLALFFLQPISDPGERFKLARRLAEANPTHPESRFLLASTALAAGDVSEARREADALAAEGIAWRRLWLLRARIARAEAGGTESPAEREALSEAAAADGDPGWRCEDCGAVSAAWHPVCPTCGAAGRLRWTAPATAPGSAEGKVELLGADGRAGGA